MLSLSSRSYTYKEKIYLCMYLYTYQLRKVFMNIRKFFFFFIKIVIWNFPWWWYRNGLLRRNNMVYTACLSRHIPLVITMGGGYSNPSEGKNHLPQKLGILKLCWYSSFLLMWYIYSLQTRDHISIDSWCSTYCNLIVFSPF